MSRSGAGGVSTQGGGLGADEDTRHLDVLLATPLFSPEYSGAAKRFERYAPGLLKRGVRLRVLAVEIGAWGRKSRYSSQPMAGSETPVGGSGGGIPVRRVPMPVGASKRRVRWRYDSAVIKVCQDAVTRPDVVITLSLMSSVSGLRFRRTGVPLVHVQTMFSPPMRRPWTGPVRTMLSRLRHRIPDCIVVSSSVMAEDLLRRGVRAHTETIPHGVDLRRFRPPHDFSGAEPIRDTLGFAPEDEVLLFVGPINERKGVDLLAETWTIVATQRPRARLLLVGPGSSVEGEDPDAFNRRIRSGLSKGPGRERVHFTGRVPNVEEYLRAADLFVFPSRREGMPNVVCEAFASGLACVLTPFLGLPDEFGTAGREYELVPRDPSAMAECIIALLSDHEHRRSVGGAARRWAERQLDVEVSLDRYAELCRGLAKVHGTSRYAFPRRALHTRPQDRMI